MLRVYHSNRLEILADCLIGLLDDPASSSVLVPEVVVTQNQGMARWLGLRMADNTGIAANIEFPFPASFIWQIFKSQLQDVPDQSGFERGVLAWRCLAVLAHMQGRRGFEDIDHYLEGDTRGFKAYQLACQVADIYDQYLVFRPEWLLQWEDGRDSHWQAQLWRAICPRKSSRHRARLLHDFVELSEQGRLRFDCLPKRVMVFGISSMPPAYLDVFARIAAGVDVHLFVLNPCLSFWGDIVEERDLVRLRALWQRHGKEDASEYYTVGNRLLASMGKQGRDFQQLLHQYACEDMDMFQQGGEHTLLGSLQHDILYLADRGSDDDAPPAVVSAGDNSLEVHVCHSPMREVQVLHDRLLARLECDRSLTPRDILVMVPDIDRYAPYIEAVFATASSGRYIPWSLADRSPRAEHSIIEAVFQVLALPAGRMTASEVMDILEVAAVMRRLSLSAADMEYLRECVREVGIRWGRNRQEREQHGLPPGNDNTWEFGLARLMLGYAMSPEGGIYRGVLPAGAAGRADARALGQLHGFVDTLSALRRLLKSTHTPERWQGIINEILDLFKTSDDDELQALQLVRNAMDQLCEQSRTAGFAESLPLDVVRDYLQKHLEQAGSSQRFLTGQVSFCAMLPMRSIPFRVVCLLGMNHADYPRQRKAPDFDLMSGEGARPGDRSRREDDRYLFLEALLSAREALHISYTGRSIRDNSVLLPSVLVSELLDVVDGGYRSVHGPIREQIVFEHPLQPYSRRYFGDDERLFSYAGEWLAARTPAERAQAFIDAPLPGVPDELRQIELGDLLKFYRNPAQYFLNRRLGIYLEEDDDVLDDSESFSLDSLQRFHLGQDLTRSMLKGEKASELYPLWQASGLLPYGAFGKATFSEVALEAGQVARRVSPLLAQTPRSVEVDLTLGDFTLRGWLHDVGSDDMVRYRYGKLRPEDQLRLWLEHLVLKCTGAVEVRKSQFIARDKSVSFTSVEAPHGLLQKYLEAFWQGMHAPLPLFPKSSLAYAERYARGDEVAAMQLAQVAWTGGYNIQGEGMNAYLALAFRGRGPFEADFTRLARDLLLPLCRAREVAS